MSALRSSPIADAERAGVLDALRGFALLGIFLSHVPGFSEIEFMTPKEQATLDWLGVDGPLSAVLEFLIRGKFYSLFSLLFGIGFAVQFESAARRGAVFAQHFGRRLAVLFVIGMAHASLWYGDILKDYALIGFALIISAPWNAVSVARAAVIVLIFGLVWPVLVAGLVSIFAPLPSGEDPGGSFFALTRAFGGTNLHDIFVANLALVRLKALQMIYEGKAISILAMFLVGALVGKLQLFRDLSAHGGLFRKVFWICTPIGVIGNAVLVPLHHATRDYPPTLIWVIEESLFAVAVPAMTLAYAAGFALLWSHGWQRVLQRLAPAGRMALTTYVSQTLIGIALFYGIGLGLRGSIGFAEGTVMAIAIFAGQCALSAFWLRTFRFGPPGMGLAPRDIRHADCNPSPRRKGTGPPGRPGSSPRNPPAALTFDPFGQIFLS